MHARSVQQGHVQVRHRRVAAIGNVAARLYTAAASASEKDRQVLMRMAIAVADAASVDDQGVIEQGSVSIVSRLQFPKETRE